MLQGHRKWWWVVVCVLRAELRLYCLTLSVTQRSPSQLQASFAHRRAVEHLPRCNPVIDLPTNTRPSPSDADDLCVFYPRVHLHSSRPHQSMDSSDLSDGPITLQEYLEVKKALASSEAKVQQLLKVNNNLSEELRRLQKEV